MSRSTGACKLVACLLVACACSSGRGTERVFDGRTVRGRYVEPHAYAAYVEGAYHEAHGNWAAAERAYRRALSSDGQSPQIWTRLGALACRDSLQRGLASLERATSLEPHAPAWMERARCLASGQRRPDALRAAQRAVQLAPRDAAANLLMVRLYRESSRADLARAWLFAWLLLEPERDGLDAELLRESELLGDPALLALARAGSPRAAAGEPALPAKGGVAARATPALLEAIGAGELERARGLAAEARLSPLELASLATVQARPELGLAQAELLLQANPRDSAALVVALLAAALLEDERAFGALLRQAQSDVLPPRELAAELTRLLRDRIGEEAADSWRDAYLRALATRATPPQ